MNGKYKKYYSKIEAKQKNFEFILNGIKNTDSFEDQLQLAQFALTYATYNNTGYFTSSFLENFFIEYANKIDIENYNIDFKKKSFLHVLTEGYLTGGHTRVVERWISHSQEDYEHSVVILNPNLQELSKLKDAVKNKNGDFISFEKKLSLEQKALKLRKIALKYEYIILHTHMEDPTATVAFGTEKFTRPVLFYNHASHMFWIGKSIADMVLDIQSDDEITIKKRQINNPICIGIPIVEKKYKKIDKIEARKKLNLPLDKKIIISSGNSRKYYSAGGDNFGDILTELIDKNTYCYLIGFKKNDFKKTSIKKHPRIKALGNIDFNQKYLYYMAAADLYLDSYPLCGATAIMDAIMMNIPVLSLKSIYPQLDYLKKSPAYCETREELIEKAKNILNNQESSEENINKTYGLLMSDLSIITWNEKINQLLKIVPKKHKVTKNENNNDNNQICDLTVFINVMNDKKFFKEKKVKMFTNKKLNEICTLGNLTKTQGIPFIFQICTYLKSNKKIKIIKFFNIKIFSYTK